MIESGKKDVLGIGVNVIDYQGAVSRIFASVQERKRCTITALAVHGLVTGALDPAHRYRLNKFDLVVPDGQPVRWALNLLYKARLKDRVYGPNLTVDVCREAAVTGTPVYFYGSRPEVLTELCQRMVQICPGLRIAGASPSRFRRLTLSERAMLVNEIRSSGAQILFVGLGCPRQEVFAYEMGDLLQMSILAVGAAFDYHAGLLEQPPEWIQKTGLQWFYRLLQEPHRLWRRYLITNSQFLCLFLLQGLRLWNPQRSSPSAPASEVRYG